MCIINILWCFRIADLQKTIIADDSELMNWWRFDCCIFLWYTVLDSCVILCWNQGFFDTHMIFIVNTKSATSASRCFHIMLQLLENEVLDVVDVAVYIDSVGR